MGKAADIIFLIILLIAIFISFPEYLNKIFSNRLYTLLAILGVFMAIFLAWLKQHGN